MAARRLVLFDVDGTLVDSNYLHTLAWSRALRQHHEWAPMNAIHRLIGMGSDALLTSLIGRRDEGLAAAWKVEYERMIDEVRPFRDVVPLFEALRRADVSIALATSAPADHLARMVEVTGVGHLFDFSTCADDVQHAKPDPEIFLTAMQRGGGEADSTFVVGDSTWDVAAATAAGLPCICVESGGFSAAELRDAGAVAVYEDLTDLLTHLATSPLAGRTSRTSVGLR